MTDMIKALIEAGENLSYEGRSCGRIIFEFDKSDSDFYDAAANARPAIKSMYEENRDLKEVLKCLLDKADIEWGPITNKEWGIWPQTRNDARAVLAKYGRE